MTVNWLSCFQLLDYIVKIVKTWQINNQKEIAKKQILFHIKVKGALRGTGDNSLLEVDYWGDWDIPT